MFTLGLAAASCVTEPPSADAQEPISSTLETVKAADYLTVESDGTLSISDDALARIPRDQREAALMSLASLNQRIHSGEEQPFVLDDPRLTAKSADPAQALVSICYCADGCCDSASLMNMCCASGFWIFCWGYGTC
ncbi:hypothetical protein [Sorangium sp. So ce1151]|uniref:hypothetical protein n=1 Tax=Sorangium sp. So ce1151 TaxID=3133332 RepID=UPI003F60E23B